MAFESSGYCSFCNMPGAKHEGGGEFMGITVSGHFCNKNCFSMWLEWKGALITFLKRGE